MIRPGRKQWTAAEAAALVARYPHEPTAVVASALGRSLCSVNGHADKLGLRKTEAYMQSPSACRLRRGDNVGWAYRFPKGNVPANKGTRRPGWSPGRMSETQFKPGQRGSRWMPIGSTRVIDGYLYTKVRDAVEALSGIAWPPVLAGKPDA